MDYYYSLLESYQQLKRRTFKLSLREQEEEQDLNAVANDVATALGDIRSKEVGYKESGLGNGKNLDVEVLDRAGVKITGGNLGWGIQLSGSQIGNLKNSWTKENSKGNRVVKAWASAGEAPKPKGGGNEGEGGGDEGEGGGDGGRIQQEKEIKEEGKKAQQKLKELQKIPGAFPDLEIDTKHTRRPESLAYVARGETQGFSGQVEDLEERVLNTESVSPEEKLKTLQGLNKTLETLNLIHQKGWSDPENVLADAPQGISEQEARDLGALLGRMKVTPQGVTIDGIALFYRGNSTPKTDALRNAAEQLNAVAKTYNSQWDEVTETQTDPKIPELKAAPPLTKSGGANESYRGPVAEKFMRCSATILRGKRDWENATTPTEKKKIMNDMRNQLGDLYEDAVEDGSLDKMIEVFGIGRSVALSEIVANREQMSDAQFVETCQKILEEQGVDPDKAAEMITQAGGQPPERGVMMALIVTTMVNQNMDEELFGDNPELIPDKIVHEGDTDSASSGKKADLVFEWDDEEKCKQIADHYKKKLGNTPTQGGCGGEGSGVKDLVTPKEGGGCRMEVELKTLTSSKGKGGAGELSQSRTTAICDDAPVVEDYDNLVLTGQLEASKGMTQATKDFAERNKKRMDGCGGEGSSDRACEQHAKIQEQGARYDRLLTPGSPGVTPERSQALLDNWWKYKRQDEAGKARYDAATRAVNGSTDKEDLKALKKVKEDIRQQIFKREIHRTSKGAGEGTGRVTDSSMRDYLLMDYSQACGSTEETMRVTRGLEDGYQGVYLNNATVEENMRMVRDEEAFFEYERGGTIINIKDKDGTTLASCDTARGNSKWTVGKSSRNKISESIEFVEPNLLLDFLQGQAALLEKLIAQTT
jgi:hypothetical protein